MRASDLAIGVVGLLVFSTVAIASCATGSSDGTDDDDDDGETIETKDEECTASQFDCGGGTCISLTYVCDGTAQCDDASDEPPINTECPSNNCGPLQFACSETECINVSSFCSGPEECATGIDEPTGCTRCPLPNTAPPQFCDEICTVIYNCGVSSCAGVGGPLCPGLASEPDFLANCAALCAEDSSTLSVATPSDCILTITTLTSVGYLNGICNVAP